MTTPLTKLIADNTWKPIAEAQKDGTDIMLIIPSITPPFDFGYFSAERNLFEGRSFKSDYDALKYLPTHFRPLPDDRLARVTEVLLDALNRIGQPIPSDATAEEITCRLIAQEALELATAIAEGKE